MTAKEQRIVRSKLKSVIQAENDYYLEDVLHRRMELKKYLSRSPSVKSIDFNEAEFQIEVTDRFTGLPRLIMKDFPSLESDGTFRLIGITDHNVISAIGETARSLRNAQDRLGLLASSNKLDEMMNDIFDACSIRDGNFKDFTEKRHSPLQPGDLIKKVAGKYPCPNPNLQYYISSDPVDIFMKSSGQEWSENSCERWGGGYKRGIFSDIANGSLVCFVTKKGKRTPANALARIMLRQCYVKLAGEPYSHVLTLGYEAYWYTGNYRLTVYSGRDLGYMSKHDIEWTMTAKSATDGLKVILKAIGLRMDYKVCMTPFPYKGFSDAIVDSGVIQYCSEYTECSNCSNPVPASLAKKYDGLCGACHEDDQPQDDGDDDHHDDDDDEQGHD